MKSTNFLNRLTRRSLGEGGRTRRSLSTGILALLLPLALAAQRTLTGTVSESSGEPLQGVVVVEEGTANGTTTNLLGKFTLRLTREKTAVVFSYTGFTKQRVDVGASNVVDATLEPDLIGLNEVVVVGYAPQRRKDLTGAVSSINANDTRDVPIPSLETALQGAAAGVMVTKNSGKPGSGIDVNIRGRTSILASNQPLYVVDGVPIISGDNFNFQRQDLGGSAVSVLSDLNPDEIESIEVLKDASTAAIYGSRAANGVVLIKTRHGQDGATKTTFNASLGTSWAPKIIEGITGEEYKQYSEELWGPLLTSIGFDPTWQNVQDVLLGPLGDANTNWQREIFRNNAPQAEYSATMSGGTAKTKAFASLGYSDQQGIIKHSGFERYSARLNVDHQVSEKVIFGMNLGYTRSNTQQIQNDNNIYGVLGAAILTPPVVPIRNPDGSWASAFGIENAVAAVTDYENHIARGRLQGNVFALWSITDWLSFKASLGADMLSSNESIYEPRTLQSSNTGSAVEANVRDERIIHEYVLNFNRSFGKNHLQVAGGTSFQQDRINDTYAYAVDFPSDVFTGLSSASTPVQTKGGFTGDNLKSFFANANFNFNSKYYLSGTFRADGSSRFLRDPWGYFPGISAGWMLSEEPFLQGKFFDLLKLRLGWGQTGNNVFGNFLARQLYGGGSNYLNTAGTSPKQIGNTNLTWETTSQTDLGLDFGFLKNRITGSLDFYVKRTKNLLLDRPIPTTTGFTSVTQNVGEVENRGIDLTLNTLNFKNRNLAWTSTFTVGFVKNKVLKLVGGVPLEAGFDNRVAEGQPIGSFFGHKTLGIFQNQAEIDAAPTQSNAAPGDIRFADISGGPGEDGILGTADDLAPDGKINADDRTYLGKAIPDFAGGLRNTLSGWGFDLNVFFQFATGFQIDNTNAVFAEGLNSVFSPTRHAWENRWKKEGDQTKVPRLVLDDPNNNRRASDRFIEDGDYLRLKTVTLGYTLPKHLLKSAGFESLRVYASGYNLWTTTKYSGYDPEVNTFDGNNTALGTDFLTFPQPRSVVFGVNASF